MGQSPGVDIVLDRRERERRQGGAHLPERRQSDRRGRQPVRDFPALGYRLVRMVEAPAPPSDEPAAPAEPTAPVANRRLFSAGIRLDDLFPPRSDNPLNR